MISWEQVVHLHKRHSGVQVLGKHALLALQGRDISGAMQKISAKQNPHEDIIRDSVI